MIHMTSEDAALSMLMGVGGELTLPKIPSNVRYYTYASSTSDMYYDGNTYTYGETREIPKDSIVFTYYSTWYNANNQYCYRYIYRIYQLIIEDIDTINEEVIGIRDMQSKFDYMFQFNSRGRP